MGDDTYYCDMIKNISRHSISTTPFVAVKAWELFNVQNDDLVLLEEFSASVNILGTFVAQDYIDYSGNPIINRECNIALEQQEDDLAVYEEGNSGSGIFYPDTEDTNPRGSYKRLIHDQMKLSFYNNYRNPLQILGMENIDFPLSQTNRYLANHFLMFSIPRKVMGDRLLEGSIQMYDTNLDDNVEIVDDSYGNLIAGDNLFSKVQEVRHLGNILFEGTSSNGCPSYNIYYDILYFSGSELTISHPVGAIDQSGGTWKEVHGYTCQNLTELYSNNNLLTVFDVSNSPLLTILDVTYNLLTSLDVSSNAALEYLSCYHNSLTSLDVSGNAALKELPCHHNSLTSLDVSNNPALTILYCFNNSLTTLDVSNNPALTRLEVDFNSLTTLDISNNPALIRLQCPNNLLSSDAIDDILLNLVNHNKTNGLCWIYANVGSPTAAGIINKNILISRGWDIDS